MTIALTIFLIHAESSMFALLAFCFHSFHSLSETRIERGLPIAGRPGPLRGFFIL